VLDSVRVAHEPPPVIADTLGASEPDTLAMIKLGAR